MSFPPPPSGSIVMINVFTVEPARQQELIALLTETTAESIRHMPGFLSSRLHRSADGTKVAMYAHWRSREDYEALRGNPGSIMRLMKILSFAKFEPGMYEVVETFLPETR